MPGWNLAEGIVKNHNINENEFWEIVNNIFSSKTTKTTSYKYGFLKSILDNIFNLTDTTISYELLFERFAEIYWNLVAKYNLCQIQATSRFAKSSVELIIEEILNKNNIDGNVSFEALKKDLKQDVVKKITNECSKYVVGAMFEDTNQSFYSFNRREKTISFNKCVVDYLIKYKNVLTKLNYFEWIKFLEKTNVGDSVFALAEKLDNSSKRGDLSFYRDFLYSYYNKKECFYCGKNLENKTIEMDHFIPWSYLKDDKQWNLVMSCRECNNSKRDKLPDKIFISKLIEQNESLLNCNNYKSVERDFVGYSHHKILKIYESAVFNGFNEIWEPRGK